MKEYTIPYGDGSVTVPLDEKQVMAVLQGNEVSALPDLRAAYLPGPCKRHHGD